MDESAVLAEGRCGAPIIHVSQYLPSIIALQVSGLDVRDDCLVVLRPGCYTVHFLPSISISSPRS